MNNLISSLKTLQAQQRPELSTVTLNWHASKYKVHKRHQLSPRHMVHKLHQWYVHPTEEVPPVEFTYLIFTRVPGESYCGRLRPFLPLFVDFSLPNSQIVWFFTPKFTNCLLIFHSQIHKLFVDFSLPNSQIVCWFFTPKFTNCLDSLQNSDQICCWPFSLSLSKNSDQIWPIIPLLTFNSPQVTRTYTLHITVQTPKHCQFIIAFISTEVGRLWSSLFSVRHLLAFQFARSDENSQNVKDLSWTTDFPQTSKA